MIFLQDVYGKLSSSDITIRSACAKISSSSTYIQCSKSECLLSRHPFTSHFLMADTSTAPPARSSRGRQKIEIKRREKVDNRRVTFTKRRTGLFEKAAELCVLCGAKVAIVTFSEGRKAFCFGNPELDSILVGYLRGRSLGEIGPSNSYIQSLDESKRLYLDASRGLETEKANWKSTVQLADATAGFWWDNPVDDLGRDKLEFYQNALEKMMNSIAVKLEEFNSKNVNCESAMFSNDSNRC